MYSVVRPGAGRAAAEANEPAAASSVVAEVSVQAAPSQAAPSPEVASTQASQLDQPLSSKLLGDLAPTIHDHVFLLFFGRTLVSVI